MPTRSKRRFDAGTESVAVVLSGAAALSYLFFNEQYFSESIDLGRRAAAAALSRGWER